MKGRLILLLLSLLPIFFCHFEAEFGLGTEQAVSVRGDLFCGETVAEGVRLRLYDEDATSTDDLMAEGLSDFMGHFHLNGTETEITTIDPKLNVYHRCNCDGICYQKLQILIPKSFVADGPEAERVFDIGKLNLAARFSGQSVDCLN